MTVRVIDNSLMLSDHTKHHARSTGNDGWVVSYLPGRTLSRAQAEAALLALEDITALRAHAGLLGLTVLEIMGMAARECLWSAPLKQGFAARALAWAGVSR
ncbi:hypothetical protein HGA13_12410 [Nocardia speluncae]|uniref:Uncharacterized protein n=1 Tax=Nocardia speluncae TaxID=419477 RepID=A0A846XGT2_9NOCA|nr:hypothetical protein [Nocardia speluncae]NKY33876.1 hypothetical protein [Nocardia speluncae]